MGHTWEMDVARSRMEIDVLVWRCKHCGCLQIKNGGLEVPSVYRVPGRLNNPFRPLVEEPACEVPPASAQKPESPLLATG